MALNAATTWEVRTTGSDNNGGGFRTGASGTDRSQQDAAFASGVNLTVDAVTNTDVAPDGITPGATDVGNIIQVTAGAGFTLGFYEIASIQSGKWRLDRSPAAVGTSGGTWALGGALASPGKAAGAKVASNTIYIKSGTYSITSASTNVSNGCISDTAGGLCVGWEGYQTSRGDLGTAPILQASGISTFTVFAVTAGSTAGMVIRNIWVDGNSRTASTGWSLARRDLMYRCRALNCTTVGFTSSDLNTLLECVATGCTTNGFGGTRGTFIACVAYANAGAGFGNSGVCIDCLAYGNTTATGYGFNSLTACVNCVAYGNAADGFRATTESDLFLNCLAEGNSGWGFTASATAAGVVVRNGATFNNTSGAVNTALIPAGVNMVVGSGSFFTNAAAGDFSLNRTAGAGAAVRNAGYPGLMPLGLTTFFKDIGAGASQSVYIPAQVNSYIG